MRWFVKNSVILSARILTLLSGLFLLGSAQAEMIYAVRVNSLNGGDVRNYYSNCQFSNGNSSSQWCSQTTSGSVPYTFQDDTHDYGPVMLCDLGVVHTINSIDISPYANANTVKALKVEFYDTPALSGTPVFTKEFSDISNTDTTTLSLGSAVLQTAEFANPVAMNTAGTFEVGEGKTLTVSGAVSGSAKLEKTGAGTLKLSNAGAFTGDIYVSEGRLDLLGSTAGSVTVGDAIFSPGNSPERPRSAGRLRSVRPTRSS